MAESTDTAVFLKSAYTTIIDTFFSDADFFKPTGDGLLILKGYDSETLEDVIRTATSGSVELVEAFPTLCDGDPMVNFDVPHNLGIGLSRGAATALTAEDKVLDFSGRPLNLASRLMDLARPSGVVFDKTFGIDLLEPDMRTRFVEDFAYVKGIADAKPLTVFRLDGFVEIPDFNKRPMDSFERFTEDPIKITFKDFQDWAPIFRHNLTREPARTDNIEVHVQYPATKSDGRKHPTMVRIASVDADYLRTMGKSIAQVDYRAPLSAMEEAAVRRSWPMIVTIEYSVAPEAAAE
jgi:hypothetical protein